MLTRRTFIACIVGMALAGCGSNSLKEELSRLEALITQAGSLDENNYPVVWMDALNSELAEAKNVFSNSDSSWKDVNIAANALEGTMSAMVERPNQDVATPLPATEELAIGSCYSFSGSYYGEKQYDKGKSYDCIVTVYLGDNAYANIEHCPLKLTNSLSSAAHSTINVEGWLTGFNDGELLFIADTLTQKEVN